MEQNKEYTQQGLMFFQNRTFIFKKPELQHLYHRPLSEKDIEDAVLKGIIVEIKNQNRLES